MPLYDKDLLLTFPWPVETYHRETYERIWPATSASRGFDGRDKTLLIAGGATGIGLEISRSFAQAGVSRIIILSRRQKPLDEAKMCLEQDNPGVRVDVFAASITDYCTVTDIVRGIGHVDILALCATYAHAHESLEIISLQAREQSYSTNVLGNFNLTKEVFAGREVAR